MAVWVSGNTLVFVDIMAVHKAS